MFIGHYAVALGAKRAAPAVSLGTLFAAAAFLDLVWPVLVLAGVERVAVAPGATAFTPLDFQYYPISHSLLMAVVWGLAFGGVHIAWTDMGQWLVIFWAAWVDRHRAVSAAARTSANSSTWSRTGTA